MNLRFPLPFYFISFFILILCPTIKIPTLASPPSTTAVNGVTPNSQTTILFNSVGRSNYNFDIYTLPLSRPLSDHAAAAAAANTNELKLTDGVSVNFNGHFPHPNYSSPLTLALPQLLLPTPTSATPHSTHLVYVSERNGTSSIYYDVVYHGDDFATSQRPGSRSTLQSPGHRLQVQLLPGVDAGRVSLKDRPTLVGEDLIYVSTHEGTGVPRSSWAAVYATHVGTGSTRRLTPRGVADFSPAVSPSGDWTAVASLGVKGWDGEVAELGTDIYVFLTRDGSSRVMVVEHGGWPNWGDDYTIYFHRKSEDGWWGVYRASLPRVGRVATESVVVERVTPPGIHSFTPTASSGNNEFIAVATRRPDSEYRHIELFDLVRSEFKELTRPVSPYAHHFNPFLSPDSTRIGYHRCRAASHETDHLFLENIQNPEPDISLFRVDGSFPSFSRTGDRIAFVKLPGLYISHPDGTNQRMVLDGNAFSTAWDPVRQGVVYTSTGPIFAAERTKVDVISINVDDEKPSYKKLTEGGENNAFPSPSPDGKWVVFRSGRSGHKNLYIMDAVEGEKGGIQRLTDGPWTDTMCNWSPDGEWIAFATDRENPGSGSYELYMIHPNGTGLQRVIKSGSAGRANHPWFSPDGKSIVFTSDYAGVSAEPIATPHQFQPYGDIFVAKLDGSGIQRLTHNSYEDGTPTWGPAYIRPADVAQPTEGQRCSFDDCHFLNVTPDHGAAEGSPMAPSRGQCV
ncbi:hypothetical protein Dimus_005282 [Dionaea muscipula]